MFFIILSNFCANPSATMDHTAMKRGSHKFKHLHRMKSFSSTFVESRDYCDVFRSRVPAWSP